MSGLRAHRGELELLIAEHQPAVICLQETNAQEGKTPQNFLGASYTLLLGPCSAHGRQGVGMAIRCGVPFERIQTTTTIQAVAVRIHLSTKITVVSVYLPPTDSEATNNLTSLLNELPKPVLLLGDLNAHHTEWGSRLSTEKTIAQKRGHEILSLFVEQNMLVLNTGSHTRCDPSTGRTQALDVSACSTSIADQFTWNVVLDCAGSDHFPIRIDTTDTADEPRHRRRWLYDRANWRMFEDLTVSTIRPGQNC